MRPLGEGVDIDGICADILFAISTLTKTRPSLGAAALSECADRTPLLTGGFLFEDMPMAHIWTAQEEEFLRINYPDQGRMWCVKTMGITEPSIRSKASQLGLR